MGVAGVDGVDGVEGVEGVEEGVEGVSIPRSLFEGPGVGGSSLLT